MEAKENNRRERSRLFRWIGISVIVGPLFVIAGILVIHHYGIFRNPSDSLPVGLYRKVDKTPEKGDYLVVATPHVEAKIYLPPRILKILVATEGDYVKIDREGIRVNGKKLERTEPLARLNLPIANVDKTLEKDEIVIASDFSAYSFDSRYFGVLKTSAILNVAEPFYTWGDPVDLDERHKDWKENPK